jgi:hypothetical protein
MRQAAGSTLRTLSRPTSRAHESPTTHHAPRRWRPTMRLCPRTPEYTPSGPTLRSPTGRWASSCGARRRSSALGRTPEHHSSGAELQERSGEGVEPSSAIRRAPPVLKFGPQWSAQSPSREIGSPQVLSSAVRNAHFGTRFGTRSWRFRDCSTAPPDPPAGRPCLTPPPAHAGRCHERTAPRPVQRICSRDDHGTERKAARWLPRGMVDAETAAWTTLAGSVACSA